MDAKILCKAGATPTGNLQASLISVTATGTAGTVTTQTINTGNQTVNFRGVGNLAGLTGTPAPNLDITKLIVAAADPCPIVTAAAYPPAGNATLLVSNTTRSVKYCYYVKNTGTAPAYGVSVSDDNARDDRLAYDNLDPETSFPVTLSGLATIDSTSTNDDLAAGALAIGEVVVATYRVPGVYANTVTASATGLTTSAKASATMINEGIIAFVKTALEPGQTDCETADRKKTVSVSTTEATQSITYCFAVTNYLTEDLWDTTLSVLDDKATVSTADDAPAITSFSGLTTIGGTGTLNDLARNATAYASLTLTKSTATSSYRNTATLTVTGTGASTTDHGRTLISKATVEFGVFEATEEPEPEPEPLSGTPRLSVVKTQTSASPARLGDTITYSIVVTNTGEVALDNVTVSDPGAVLGACSPSNPVAQLRINLTITCSATRVVVEADVTTGSVANVAVVNASHGGSPFGPTNSNTVTTPIEKNGVTESAVPTGKKPKDPTTKRSGDPASGPGSLPSTGADFTALLTGMWLVIGGILLAMWARPMRRRKV